MPRRERQPIAQRLARFSYRDERGCLLWTGALKQDGYGLIKVEGKMRLAHVIAFEEGGGMIPEGMQLDHGCRVRRCIEFDHLEPVTCQVNLLRGETLAARNAFSPTCIHGHPWTEESTYRRPDGKRNCKICRDERSRAHYARQKEKRVA